MPVNGRPGTHDFTVRAKGTDGAPAQLTATYTVGGAPSDPLVVTASVNLGDGIDTAPPTVTYGCSGGTPPRTCAATLDKKPIEVGAPLPCGGHTVSVSATDAAGQTKEEDFAVQGRQC